jgi:hypothetical protein
MEHGALAGSGLEVVQRGHHAHRKLSERQGQHHDDHVVWAASRHLNLGYDRESAIRGGTGCLSRRRQWSISMSR